MSWLDRGRDRLQELGKQAEPRSEQIREEAGPRLQAARTSAEKAGLSVRSRMDEISRAFREGAEGDDDASATNGAAGSTAPSTDATPTPPVPDRP